MGFPIQVASRYAKSLMTLAQEKNLVEEFKKDLATYMEVFYQNYDFNLLMHSPIVTKGKKIAIVKQIFDDQISEPMMAFFILIIRKGRADGLDEISQEFLKQYDISIGVQKAVVTSAAPLSTAAKQKINDLVAKKFNKTIELKEQIDESLIGGYVLRIEDIQVDTSVKSQLREIKNSIA